MRLLFVIILGTASAVALHYSGIISEFQENLISPKKLRAVKPDFTHKEAEYPVVNKSEYTFFKTLNDPTMTQYMDLKGRLMSTGLSPENKTTVPAEIETTPSTSLAEKIMIPEPFAKPEIKQNSKQETRPIPEIKETPSYAVQVSSFRDETRAGALKTRLQENGFDAFLMQAELADHGGTWHRVFLGRYVDEQKAQEAAHLARSEYKLNAVVVRKTN